MLNRIRQLIMGGSSPTGLITNKRLMPDPNRVRSGFSFDLRGLRQPKGEGDALRAEEGQFLRSLEARGLKRTEIGIPLNSPFLEDVLRQFQKWKREPHFRFSGEFTFALNPSTEPSWEWFEIHPHAESSVDLRAWACRADRMPTGRGWIRDNFLTESSKRIIEEAGLTGLELTWVRDVGRYQAEQWYHAMATKPLGRGLDHPFFEPAKFVQPDYIKSWATLDEWRFGMTQFKKSEFASTASFGIPALDGILELGGSDSLEISSFRQMLREFIPPVDFAYVWDYRLPTLCCNTRARDLLVKNRLLALANFVPIWVWDTVPKGATVLDCDGKQCVFPYPMTAAMWKAVLEKVRPERQNYLTHPKAPCVTTPTEVLSRLRESHPEKAVIAGVPPHLAMATTIPKLPKLWEQVLGISENFRLLATEVSGRKKEWHGYDVVPLSELADFQRITEESARHFIPDFPTHLTHFAHDGEGSWLTFDMKSQTPEGDCRIMKWRHDTLCVVQEWPSIVQLLEESLELAEKEEADGED